MKVMKFGGTSVGSIEGILQVKRIVESVNEPVVVVVSATNTTTDTLISMTEMAQQGEDIQTVFDALQTRHMDIIQAVVPSAKTTPFTVLFSTMISSTIPSIISNDGSCSSSFNISFG